MMNESKNSRAVRQSRAFPTTIMNSTFQPINRRLFTRLSVVIVLLGLHWASGLRAQSPEEHASHHPGQAGGAMPAATPGSAGGMGGMSAAGGGPGSGRMGPPAGVGPPGGAGGMGGMMGGGMGGMMEKMGAPKPKDFYPTLMDLPDLPLTKRLEVGQQAGERMQSGVALMNEGLEYLLQATEQQNYSAMQAGTANLREGLARFESGLAAQRALAEGKAPRNVALTWFKRDMNLLPLPGTEPRALLGVTPFHLFTMALLIVFALAMVAMYFFKMRRAAALFGRIEDDKKSPPPGSAPELAGGKPPDGKKPASGGKPAPADKAAPAEKPAAPADKPAADKPAAGADKPAAAGDKPAAPDNKLAAAAEKLADAAVKLATAAEKLAAPPDKPVAPVDKPPSAEKPPSGDKPAATGDKAAPPADKPAAAPNKPAVAADKPVTPATKAAAPDDKPAAPADKASAPAGKPAADAPPKGNGSAPSAPAQERPAATKFECLAPAARAVFLVGTFNDWNAKATPMTKDAKGNWDIVLALPPGRHEFKFVVDGDLCCEPGCEGPHQGCPKCVPNASGTMNRFIEVKSI